MVDKAGPRRSDATRAAILRAAKVRFAADGYDRATISVLHPGHHGHGYAPEAGRALLRLAFEGLGLHRVVGRLDARNTASARVLEKLGMRHEATLVDNEIVKGEWSSESIYAILDREWAT